jgi:sulfur-oxidizing protein SoxY
MQYTKRILLKGGMALLAFTALPRFLLAAAWPQNVFGATGASDALKALLGTDVTIPTDKIELKVPEIAENGAVVPVTVNTSLEGVESIIIVVKNNPRPLASTF